MSKTLYHASLHAFSAVDDAKLGSGQNLHGRGLYLSDSPTDCMYFITEDGMMDFGVGNRAVDAFIYAFDLPSDAQVLETGKTLSLDLKNRIQQAGQKLGENDIAGHLCKHDKVDDNFKFFASSTAGGAVLRAAGVDVLATDSYYCVLNTEKVGNLRLWAASGAKQTEQKDIIAQAQSKAEDNAGRVAVLLKDNPSLGAMYQGICDGLAKAATARAKIDVLPALTASLNHLFLAEVEEKPDPQKNILPLNRFLSETREKLGLYDDARIAEVTNEVQQVIRHVHQVPEPQKTFESKFVSSAPKAVENLPVEKRADEHATGPYKVDNLFPEENSKRGIVFPDAADEKLFQAAENLVSMLNKMHAENGHVPTDLRDAIVQNTARLAAPTDSPHYRHDRENENMAWKGNIRDQVNGAGYLHTQIKMLSLAAPDSVSRDVGQALRSFVSSFADAKWASVYTALALQVDAPDADAVVAKLNKQEGLHPAVQQKPATQHL